MIELIPAIDIINGQCVRLTKGDYDQKTVYRDAPAEVAKEFEQIGFRRLHVVDLDGAKSKHIVNDTVLKGITKETNLVVDFGGGIKTDEDIEKAFAAGASMDGKKTQVKIFCLSSRNMWMLVCAMCFAQRLARTALWPVQPSVSTV